MSINSFNQSDEFPAMQAQSLQLLCALATGKVGDLSVASMRDNSSFRKLFLEQVYWHQLAPLIDQSNDQVRACLPNGTDEAIKNIKLQLAASALKHTRETLSLIQDIATAGIRVICLKGPGLSQQLYGTPLKRHSRDIDLLVSINDVPEVARLLLRSGYACEIEEFLQPDLYCQYTFLSKDVSFYHPVKNIVIELHWRLMSNPELLPIGFEAAWSARDEVLLNDSPVAVLGSIDNMLYLACHGSIAHWTRLKWVADWHQLMMNEALDWERSWGVARYMDKEIYLENAFENASYWFGTSSAWRPLRLTGRAARHLTVTNRNAQLRCEYPSVTKGAFNRLLMAGSPSAIWQEYRRSLGTSVSDITYWRLPNRLFLLYYLLRPLIYLARRMRRSDLP